ncbi:hypothetical protein DICA0_F16314 [Diutina catenulata]
MVKCIVCDQDSPANAIDIRDVNIHDSPIIYEPFRDGYKIVCDMNVLEYHFRFAKAMYFPVHDTMYVIDNEGTILCQMEIEPEEDGETHTLNTLEEALKKVEESHFEFDDDECKALAEKYIKQAVDDYCGYHEKVHHKGGACHGRCIVYHPTDNYHCAANGRNACGVSSKSHLQPLPIQPRARDQSPP